jgi:hypothetical protein
MADSLAREITRRRVPDKFQLGAILPCSAFFGSRKINKLRVDISTAPASKILTYL